MFFIVFFVGIWCFLRFSAIPLDFFQKVVYTMLQEPDFLTAFIDSFKAIFASSSFRILFFGVLIVFFFITCMRCIFRCMSITCQHYKPRKQVEQSEKEFSCAFHCDCEDCNSYESGKYCSRCDRFQICAYCSAREHCDL